MNENGKIYLSPGIDIGITIDKKTGYCIAKNEKIPEITLLHKFLHLFGIHLKRTSSYGLCYCRICGRVF